MLTIKKFLSNKKTFSNIFRKSSTNYKNSYLSPNYNSNLNFNLRDTANPNKVYRSPNLKKVFGSILKISNLNSIKKKKMLINRNLNLNNSATNSKFMNLLKAQSKSKNLNTNSKNDTYDQKSLIKTPNYKRNFLKRKNIINNTNNMTFYEFLKPKNLKTSKENKNLLNNKRQNLLTNINNLIKNEKLKYVWENGEIFKKANEELRWKPRSFWKWRKGKIWKIWKNNLKKSKIHKQKKNLWKKRNEYLYLRRKKNFQKEINKLEIELKAKLINKNKIKEKKYEKLKNYVSELQQDKKRKQTPKITRSLSRKIKYLRKSKNWKLTKYIKFLRRSRNKMYRFKFYLRKNLIKTFFNLPYTPPHKNFDLIEANLRLDFIVYKNKWARSIKQAQSMIKDGIFSVDKEIIKKPSFKIKIGSVINLENYAKSSINGSYVRNPNPFIMTEEYNINETTKILPRYLGTSTKQLNWITYVLRAK